MVNKSIRHNKGKLKWSLVHFASLESLVKVLEFGSSKYFSIFAPELENILKKWNVKTAEEIGILEQKDFVQVAMKHNCLIRILNVERLSENIKKNTVKKILKSLGNSIGTEKQLEEKNLVIKKGKEMNSILEDMEYLQKNLTEEKKKVVSFVEKNLPLCTQITTIQLENLEISFAVSAITGLDSSMMTLQILEELLNISIDIEKVTKKAVGNWKIGLDETEILESIQRHLALLMDGEIEDKESSQYHIAHIMTNCMFWIYHHNLNKLNKQKENDN